MDMEHVGRKTENMKPLIQVWAKFFSGELSNDYRKSGVISALTFHGQLNV
jgi:hypothetical protein